MIIIIGILVTVAIITVITVLAKWLIVEKN